ncbi:MAG: HNH endonuclease signature motif containing protein [Sporomusa sp.]
MFNANFGTSLNVGRISGSIKRFGLTNDRDSKFSKGRETWNKGMKGLRLSQSTEFKNGNIPANHKPVGSERVAKNGYIEIKVAEPRTWKAKHRIVWEEANGPVPNGHAVIFADGNQLNSSLENLILVSRAELLVANNHQLIKKDAGLTRVGIQTAKLISKTQELSKRMNNG